MAPRFSEKSKFAALQRAALSLPEWVVTSWPGPIGNRLRRAFWSTRLGSMGPNCNIEVGVRIQRPEYVHLGPNVWLDSYAQIIAGPVDLSEGVIHKPNPDFTGRPGEVYLKGFNHIAPFCLLQGHAGLSLGRDVGVAAHSTIYTVSNHYRSGPQDDEFDGIYEHPVKFSPFARGRERCVIAGPVVFHDGSGLGLRGVALPGANVGRFTWVGVGGVVVGSLPEGGIAAGNPAKIVKLRWPSPSPNQEPL